MTAKEMFEELDFRWKETKDIIEYNRSLFKHFTFLQREKITFFKNDCLRLFWFENVSEVNEKLLQAINKQCEELGWYK